MKRWFNLILSVLLTVLSAEAEDYYWVGGQGSWSDLNHWRTSNNQIPGEVADANDNVIFNENSFENKNDTIFILTGNPTCHNMTWTNIPDSMIISGGSEYSSFDIFGSVTMHPKVKNRYEGKITFLSNQTGNTITSAGTIFCGDLVFEGNGEWIIQDKLAMIDDDEFNQYFGSKTPGKDASSMIRHLNGSLDANGQIILATNFSTTGNNLRKLDLENAHVYITGGWMLNGENLDFNSVNSSLIVVSSISNTNGDEIQYNDVEFVSPFASMVNINIHTVHRKVHFKGGGTVNGNSNPGSEGIFTIDTLIFSGSRGETGTIQPVSITGPGHKIQYTRVDTAEVHFNVNDGNFHRIDINGLYLGTLSEGTVSKFSGIGNTIDTILFIRQAGCFKGGNTVTGLLYFKRESAINGNPGNTIHHAVFSSDGYISGSNDFERLTLSTGYWYQLQADSLVHPGSIHTYSHVQTINQLEITGDCGKGMSMLTSSYDPIQAVINYTGGPLTTEYLQVQDIFNTGQTLYVSNGIDAGNNNGIQFTNPLQPRTLHWVNGQGEWNNVNHWSLSSNGTGDQCPPTRLDDVYFDSGSGFTAQEDSVIVNLPHIHCNNMTWVDGFSSLVKFVSCDTVAGTFYNDTTHQWINDTLLLAIDTCSLHIMGSIELDPQLVYQYFGDVYFESEMDDVYEIIDLKGFGNSYNLLNKAYFDGNGGKWKVREGTKFLNMEDTVYFRMGELLIVDDTMRVFNFTSADTLPRKLTFQNQTFVSLHQWGANAWNVNAAKSFSGQPLLEFDAGQSTIRTLGNKRVLSLPEGQCNIRTYGGSLEYHNIEFGSPYSSNGAYSMLISQRPCSYNLVDFYYTDGMVTDTGFIDTLTWHSTASNSFVLNQYFINYVISYGENNSLFNSHEVDTVLFYGKGTVDGEHRIGFMECHKAITIRNTNIIDTAILLMRGDILGKNRFSQLELSPGFRYIFQHENGTGNDTTIIENDLIINGFCDKPIRLQSNSIGSQANILYKAFDPTYPDITATYTSILDIGMIPFNENNYIAENSVDLGNNENWTFISPSNNIYYWIGGQGFWHDWQHWSASSGGQPLSEQCIPREINTVIFDNNSFENPSDTVFINEEAAYCKNMWWKQNGEFFTPVFSVPDSVLLYIYGSMMLNDSMDFRVRGDVYFDQYNEIGDLADTISSHDHWFRGNVYLQGLGDEIILSDPMQIIDSNNNVLYHMHGTFDLQGNSLTTGGYFSDFKSPRILNMENSSISVHFNNGRAWCIDGTNFELMAGNSTLINRSNGGSIITQNGDYFQYNNIIVEGSGDSIGNFNNLTEYNVVNLEGSINPLTGDFIADTVLIKGQSSAMFAQSKTNVVIIDGNNGSVNGDHQIGRCIVNKKSKISGNNNIAYCIFFDDGTFLGQNVFDTLILYPGQGTGNNQGNWFYFQIDSIQLVNDSLYIRGNQCSNMNISTSPPNSTKVAWLKKDTGFDVSADYLNIYNVGANSDGDVTFYAGNNSTPLPDPENPPPGWVFDNAQGYIPGFNGMTDHYCEGDGYVIDASAFNGDPTTQYFWEGSLNPGSLYYPVSEPGTYHIEVVYYEGCSIIDSINIERSYPPEANIIGDFFCEGEQIELTVEPDDADYSYEWWNGETTALVLAQLDDTGEISVEVTDLFTGCKTTALQVITVKPTPDPEESLGEDLTIKFEESVVLDAGPGEYYEWSATPLVPIENPYQRHITVYGHSEPVEFAVSVELDGCLAEGYITVMMFPPSRLGVPTVFSPNGDGLNDILYILGSGFKQVDFTIYNRYGQQVFNTTDPLIGWDGTVNGAQQEVDVYTWHIHVVFQDGEVIEKSGNVSLLR